MGPEEKGIDLIVKGNGKIFGFCRVFLRPICHLFYIFWAALDLHCGMWALRDGIWAFYSCGMQASLVMAHWFEFAPWHMGS